MYFSWIPLLIVLTLQLPFGPAPEKPEEERSPVKGWRMVSYFAVPPTLYSNAGKGTIKAESLGGRSALFKDVKEEQKKFPILSWRWKISNTVRSAIETRKDRFDAPARVIVVFRGEKVSWFRTGSEPSGTAIEYIWASHLPKGRVFTHPGKDQCKVIVLESGDGKAGGWVFEERNIVGDFKAAFGTKPGEALALGIETDTDHSHEKVTAYYSDPVLRRK
jgi:hypothetical protein